jgi:hypothetical protein
MFCGLISTILSQNTFCETDEHPCVDTNARPFGNKCFLPNWAFPPKTNTPSYSSLVPCKGGGSTCKQDPSLVPFCSKFQSAKHPSRLTPVGQHWTESYTLRIRSVVGWDTMLQAVEVDYSIYLILSAVLGPGVYSASNRNEFQKHKKSF